MARTAAVKKDGGAARLGIGGNSRAPLITAEQLEADNAELVRSVDELIAEAAKLDVEITSDEGDANATEIGRAVVKLQREVEDARKVAKRPIIDAGNIIDSWFKLIDGRLEAAAAKLRGRLRDYKLKKAAAEQARRDEEARIAWEAAEAAATEAARAQAEADRERQEREMVAAFGEPVAPQPPVQEDKVAVAQNAALDAALAARNAVAAAAAPVTDITRSTAAGGVGGSALTTEWKFQIEDMSKVPLEDLRQFISAAEIEKAVGRYVRLHKGSRPLPGVRIFEEAKTRLY